MPEALPESKNVSRRKGVERKTSMTPPKGIPGKDGFEGMIMDTPSILTSVTRSLNVQTGLKGLPRAFDPRTAPVTGCEQYDIEARPEFRDVRVLFCASTSRCVWGGSALRLLERQRCLQTILLKAAKLRVGFSGKFVDVGIFCVYSTSWPWDWDSSWTLSPALLDLSYSRTHVIFSPRSQWELRGNSPQSPYTSGDTGIVAGANSQGRYTVRVREMVIACYAITVGRIGVTQSTGNARLGLSHKAVFNRGK
ncbi:hypothetical protein DFH09DRAFT_1098558 [Mycena vulgaris]|nr:hypothetical protein DFH09DRAFT_1098558 [Mycena vulgaris]